MSRKSVLLALGIVLLLLTGTGTTLALLVCHEPDFYVKAYVPPGKEREELATKFANRYWQFLADIKNEEKKCDTEFTQDQINSFLEEDLARPGNVEKHFPEGVRDPRIVLEDDKVRFAFRYGEEPWSTVVSIDLIVWLPKQEPNTIALQLDGLRAGLLPISAQSILDRFSDLLRRQDIDIAWYRHAGKPLALLRFQPGPKTPTVLLRNLRLEPGKVRIGVGAGGAAPSDEPPVRAMLPETIRPLGN